jgi:exopolyphosphatase/guanosine-5'-triphosphate,3'-diphosphate pyrophosphatase
LLKVGILKLESFLLRGNLRMKRYAAIDIGAHAIKIKIVEYTKQDKAKILEDIIHPVSLGLIVLQKRKLDQIALKDMTQTLLGFKRLMQEYDVSQYRAVGTGVVRDAENGRFAIALLMKRTGLKIEILEESLERFLTYVALNQNLDEYDTKRREGMLVVEVGSTSSEVIVYKDNKLVRNNELHIGTLKLKSMMKKIERVSLYTPQIIEDHIYALTANLQSYLVRQQIKHFVMIGADIKRIKEILWKTKTVSIEEFQLLKQRLYKREHDLYQQITSKQLDYDEFLVAVIIFSQFIDQTVCDVIEVPDVSLRDGLLIAMHYKIENFDRSNLHTKDVLSASRYVAKRYHSTMPHIRQLEKIVVRLFDVYSGNEQFSEKDLLKLRLAAILHETGKFSRQVNYHSATYQSITHATLLGLNQVTLEEVAQIAMQAFAFAGESVEEMIDAYHQIQLKTIKLGLLLALADALDKSKKQNVKIVDLFVKKDSLIVVCEVTEIAFLEEWAVQSLQESFNDVFGQQVILRLQEVIQ